MTPDKKGAYVPDDLRDYLDDNGRPHPFGYYAARWDLDATFATEQASLGLQRDLLKFVKEGGQVIAQLSRSQHQEIDTSHLFQRPARRRARGEMIRPTKEVTRIAAGIPGRAPRPSTSRTPASARDATTAATVAGNARPTSVPRPSQNPDRRSQLSPNDTVAPTTSRWTRPRVGSTGGSRQTGQHSAASSSGSMAPAPSQAPMYMKEDTWGYEWDQYQY